MSNCVLIRHAETDMAGRFCGHADPPLNAAGRRQAQELAETFAVGRSTALIYTSDLARARQTADEIAARCGVEALVRPALREIGFGRWEGLTWDEVEQRYAEEAETWLKQYPQGTITGAESFSIFRQRVREEMEFLLGEAKTYAVAAITHAGFIRTALVEVCGWPEQQAREKSARYGAIVTAAPIPFGDEPNSCYPDMGATYPSI